ncbi:lipid II:glycine glycyltransferase FemX [Candidatus Omnitrophota bacterium]
MRIEIRNFGQEEWNNIICQFEGVSLLQTWEFGEAKTKTGLWNVKRMVFHRGDKMFGAAQVMVKTIPILNRGLVWINRAPLCKKHEGVCIDGYADMLTATIDYWVNQQRMYLRIVPSLLEAEENKRCIESTGLSYLGKGWASELLDLTCSEKELRMHLHQKWRNCLSKAERLGVQCAIGNSADLMSELLFDHRRTLTKNKFKTSVSQGLIKNIQELLPPARKMLVFAGRKDGKKLGSILVAGYGDVCIYLVGALNDDGRKVNAGNYLLWRSVCEMKKRGYKWFDLGGVDPHKTPARILHFKRGLGAIPYSLVGEFEACNKDLLNLIIKGYIRHFRK